MFTTSPLQSWCHYQLSLIKNKKISIDNLESMAEFITFKVPYADFKYSPVLQNELVAEWLKNIFNSENAEMVMKNEELILDYRPLLSTLSTLENAGASTTSILLCLEALMASFSLNAVFHDTLYSLEPGEKVKVSADYVAADYHMLPLSRALYGYELRRPSMASFGLYHWLNLCMGGSVNATKSQIYFSIVAGTDWGVWLSDHMGEEKDREGFHSDCYDLLQNLITSKDLTTQTVAKWLVCGAYFDSCALYSRRVRPKVPASPFIRSSLSIDELLYMRAIDGGAWSYGTASGELRLDTFGLDALILSVLPNDMFDFWRDIERGEGRNLTRVLLTTQTATIERIAQLLAVVYAGVYSSHIMAFKHNRFDGSVGVSIGAYSLANNEQRATFSRIWSKVNRNTIDKLIEMIPMYLTSDLLKKGVRENIHAWINGEIKVGKSSDWFSKMWVGIKNSDEKPWYVGYEKGVLDEVNPKVWAHDMYNALDGKECTGKQIDRDLDEAISRVGIVIERLGYSSPEGVAIGLAYGSISMLLPLIIASSSIIIT